MGVSDFPSSRIHLWSSQQTGKVAKVSLSPKCVGSIVISEHVLRRAAKLSSVQRAGFDCFLLGTPKITNQTVSVCVDRMDHGKETISDGKIVKVPTMLIPGDMILPTKILSEEDSITYTTDQYLHSFNELEETLKKGSNVGELLKMRCIISLMPDDDLGTPLKVTCEMVYPGIGFELKPVAPLPLASTPITRSLSGDLAGVTKSGYLTLDRARRGVLILSGDQSNIADSILVGGWISLPLPHPINSDPSYPLGPAIWQLLLNYTFNTSLIREAQPPAPFLLCVLSGGSVLTWECSVNQQLPSFRHVKCTKYVVVPDTQISDTTTFYLENVPSDSNANKMFTSALNTITHNIWDKSGEEVDPDESGRGGTHNDLEPRPAPSATPSKTPSAPRRSLSPLSILGPSSSASLTKANDNLNKSILHSLQLNNICNGVANVRLGCDGKENGITADKTEEENGYTEGGDNDYTEDNGGENGLTEGDKASSPPDPTYPPNSLLSPTHYPPGAAPFDPRYMYAGRGDYTGRGDFTGRSESDMYSAHSRQGSDPYSAPGIHSPISPYYYNPYIDPIRYQYPYPHYPPMYPHNVPAFYPPNYSPSRRSKKLSKEKGEKLPKEKSAFRTLGRASPNKRTNHRSPEKSSFSSANKSVCSTSTVSSRDSTNNSSRSKRSGRNSAKKQLYPESNNTTRSMKSSASSSVSERRKDTCIRDTLDKSSRSSRTASSQSESASISAKALKMLTLQKRQLDHLQQQVSLLMKNAHTTTQPQSEVVSLDKSIETMRNQMEILEQQIDKGVSSSTETNDMCVGTGESLVLTENTATEMTQHQLNDQSAQCPVTWSHDVSRDTCLSERCCDGGVCEPSEADSASFYLRFKENEDPHRSNGWDSSDQNVKFSPDDVVSTKYRDQSIFQHPKIQAPSLSHSIYNSVYFGEEFDKSSYPSSRSPVKPEYSVASRKYLEKHQLVSPPTKHVDKRKKEKIVYKNGKIMQRNMDPESVDLHRLELK